MFRLSMTLVGKQIEVDAGKVGIGVGDRQAVEEHAHVAAAEAADDELVALDGDADDPARGGGGVARALLRHLLRAHAFADAARLLAKLILRGDGRGVGAVGDLDLDDGDVLVDVDRLAAPGGRWRSCRA